MDYYLAHGKGLAGTMRGMGYPASGECLCGWINELAPRAGEIQGAEPESGSCPARGEDTGGGRAGSRSGTAAEVAEKHGVSRTAPHVWRREMMGDNGGDTGEKGVLCLVNSF